MAKLKKNAINQVMFTMVDKTDFATIEASLASDFTVKKFGVAANATVASAVITTVASAVKKVGSGVYKIALTASQCNYDQLMLRIAHASAATQMMWFELATANDADVSDYLSKLQSRIPSLLATNSGLSDIVSKAVSHVSSRVWAHVKGASALSLLSQLRVRTNWSTVSDLASKITSRVWAADLAGTSMASNIASQVWAHTKGASALSLLSQLRVRANYSTASDLISQFWSAKYVGYMNVSALNSTMAYRLTGRSIASDIASQVWAHVKATSVLSRIPALTATKSMLSRTHSAVTASQLNSIMWFTAGYGGSNVQSQTIKLASRITKPVASQSALSKVYSRTTTYGASGVHIAESDLSDIRSAIAAGPAATVTASDINNIASAVWSEKINTYSAVVSTFGSGFAKMKSRVAVGPGASDIASKVWTVNYTTGGFVTATTVGSMLRLRASTVSTIYSVVNAAASTSDLVSKVWNFGKASAVAAGTMGSVVQGVTATVSTSAIQRMGSRVWSNVKGASVASIVSQLRVRMNYSNVSDLNSYIWASAKGASALSLLSQLRVRAAWSTVSDLASKLAIGIWGADIGSTSMASNIASQVWALHHAANSGASTYGSRIGAIFALTSNVNSKVISLAGSRLSGISDVLSKVYALTSVMGTPSNVASAVWASAKGASVASLVSQLRVRMNYSNVAGLASKITSNVWAANIAGASMTSNIASQVWAAHWTVHSAASSFGSAYEQILKKASYISDVSSKTLSMMTGQSWLSNLASVVWAEASTISTVVVRTGSAVWANAKATSVLSRLPKITASKSALSHVKSAITKEYSAVQPSQLNSVIWNTATYGGSDVQSIILKLKSRIGKSVASKSALSHFRSQANAYDSGVYISKSDMSDLRSAISAGPATANTTSIAKAVWQMQYSLYGSNASSYGSMVRVFKTTLAGVATSDYVSKVGSSIESHVSGITATVDKTAVASAVWANVKGASVASLASQIRARMAWSTVSDLTSKIWADASGMSDMASRTAAAVWGVDYSNYKAASTYGSVIEGLKGTASAKWTSAASAVWAHAKATSVLAYGAVAASAASDANARLNASAFYSDIASQVWTTTLGVRVDSRLKLVQSDVSNIHVGLDSQFAAGQKLGTTGKSQMRSLVDARMDTAFVDSDVLTANGLKERVRGIEWVLRNKMKVIKATGATIIYKDDNTATAASTAAALTSDATSVVRKRMAT